MLPCTLEGAMLADQDLGANLFLRQLLQSDCRRKSRGAAADNDDVYFHRFAFHDLNLPSHRGLLGSLRR